MAQAFDGQITPALADDMKKAGVAYGLSIGRRAPLHRMHIDCILEIARAGLKPVVIIGSVNTAGDPLYDPLRNPLTVAAQMKQLRDALPPALYAQCTFLTLADEQDDAVWMDNLTRLLQDHGMAGQAVMHFRAKAADAATQDAVRCRPLGAYKETLMARGISIWQSYNADVADDDINASALRQVALESAGEATRQLAPRFDALARDARAQRCSNPDGEMLDAAGLPVTMLDHTLMRLYRETGLRTREVIERLAHKGHVSLTALMAATQAHIDALKRKPLLAAPLHPQAFSGATGFDALPVSAGTYQSGETFTELFYGDQGNAAANAARIRDARAYVVHATARPVGDNVQHLLHAVHTLKHHGASHVTAVLPFAAYARQDRAFDGRLTSVAAAMLPAQIKAAGADAVIAVTLHSQAATAFYKAAFGDAFVHVSTAPVFATYLKKQGLENAVIGAPDGGEKPHDEGIARAQAVGQALSAHFTASALCRISKTHTAACETKVTAFQGDVRGKAAVLVDDMVDGGSTLINAARVLKDQGAAQVVCCVTHGVLTSGARPALEKLLSARTADGQVLVDRFVVTDSVPDVAAKVAALPAHLSARVDILPLAPVLEQAMLAHHARRFKRPVAA